MSRDTDKLERRIDRAIEKHVRKGGDWETVEEVLQQRAHTARRNAIEEAEDERLENEYR